MVTSLFPLVVQVLPFQIRANGTFFSDVAMNKIEGEFICMI